MVVSFEFQDFLAAGGGARHTQRRVYRFGAGVAKAHQFGTGHDACELFRQFDLKLMLRGIELAVAHRFFHEVQDRRRTMTQKHGTLRQRKIEVDVFVGIDHAGALRAAEVKRRLRQSAYIAADATGQRGLCPLV